MYPQLSLRSHDIRHRAAPRVMLRHFRRTRAAYCGASRVKAT